MKKLKNILLEAKAKKPDYIDLDKDGDTEESMKKAAADKNSMKEEEDAIHAQNVAILLVHVKMNLLIWMC